MKNLLEYRPEAGVADNLVQIEINNGDTVFSGGTEYQYREEYVVTRGIKKGLQRFQTTGLLSEGSVTTGDAFLETASNNLLPGISREETDKAQYIKFRGGTSLAEQSDAPKIDILVSQCLFGVTGNMLHMADGASVPMTSPKSVFSANVESLDIDDELSLYETESIRRQAALVEMITDGNSLYNSVTIGLPRVGYYLHALKPYAAGMLSADIALSWFDAVDKRHATVMDEVKDSLQETDLPLRVVTPLDEAELTLRDMVRANKPIELEPLLGALSESDILWNAVLKHNTPTGLYQLKGDFADAVEELRLPEGSNTRLIVKSPKEEGTFELNNKLAKDIGLTVPVVAMYALPQIMTRSAGPGLYQMTTNPTDAERALLDKQY